MSLSRPYLVCLGASHKTAPIALREQLCISPDDLLRLMPKILSKFAFDELFILSTCNRFEMYFLAKEKVEKQKINDAYLEIQFLANKKNSNVLQNAEALLEHTYFFEDIFAVEHIFSVCSSLDSLIIGETQITGQFKNFVDLAIQAKTIGPYLNRLYQDALAVSKKVRAKTKLGEKTVSISHAAIDLAKRVFRDLSEHSFLIIGAGEMAQVAARYACNYEPKNLFIINRTYEKAENLVETLSFGSARSWDQLEEILCEVDIVISSTSSQNILIDPQLMKKVMEKRKGKTLFLVDIALPRDIDSRCSEIDEVYLFEIDDLQRVVNKNKKERQKSAEDGFLLIQSGAQAFDRWLSFANVKPVLSEFSSYLDDLMLRELNKTLNRSMYSDLSENQKDSLNQMLKAISGKILGDAAKAINLSADDKQNQIQLAQSLSLMFTKNSIDEQTYSEIKVPCQKKNLHLSQI